ncbi:MAG: helix-turn-helix domain-containing protein [Oscillospiraceae bacterium]|nr:helix-turn-helix domain-containing protein [Oscillospiraceae bacterium]
MLTDCQLNKDTMRHIKNGKIPSADRILIIADYLDCSIDYLLGRTDNPNVNR